VTGSHPKAEPAEQKQLLLMLAPACMLVLADEGRALATVNIKRIGFSFFLIFLVSHVGT
jgi:hypothetical protein